MSDPASQAPDQSPAKDGQSGAFAARPPGADAVLVLDDGEVYWGRGAGAATTVSGEVCFNTAMTGYQETLTDPSYAGQIITFTFPHIGNVGVNEDDMESARPAVRGCVLRAPITGPASWRAAGRLDGWLKAKNLVAVTGIDTRALTRHIRDAGAPVGTLSFAPGGDIDIGALLASAKAWPGLEGMDLAGRVTCEAPYEWNRTEWALGSGYGVLATPRFHVVAVDFGAKRNILRCLAGAGCRVTVVPAATSAEDILKLDPDGVFLSNGPGDPAATGKYAVPMIKGIVASGKPLFAICLGHQLLALALGAKTSKMHLGHRGANQPVKDLETGRVEITSQNHGFRVETQSLPEGVIETHRSLFDGSNEGLRLEGRPVFSVQYHPEASPGPRDSHYLFGRFVETMEEKA